MTKTVGRFPFREPAGGASRQEDSHKTHPFRAGVLNGVFPPSRLLPYGCVKAQSLLELAEGRESAI